MPNDEFHPGQPIDGSITSPSPLSAEAIMPSSETSSNISPELSRDLGGVAAVPEQAVPDPVTQFQRSYDRAYEVASVQNTDRSDASANRQASKAMESLDATYQTLPSGDSRRERRERRKQEDSAQQVYREAANNLEAQKPGELLMSDVRNAPYAVQMGDRLDEQYLEQYRRAAAEADERADRLEEWAEVLQDHPVSREYDLSQHVFLGPITPEALIDKEDRMKTARKFVEDLKSEMERMTGIEAQSGLNVHIPKIFDSNRDRFSTSMTDLLNDIQWSDRDRAEDLVGTWTKLVANPDTTTLGQIKEFHKGLIQSHLVDKLEDNIFDNQKLLDDIKSGRASQPTTPTESRAT